MNFLIEFWNNLTQTKKITFTAISSILILVLIYATFSIFHKNYQLLFSKINREDAALIIKELQTMKIDYEVRDGGEAIAIADANVDEVRLKLMTAELPLSGGLGFELFDKADYGMTEFAQKINYQRALQGELARTIMSFKEVESARVHLMIPDASPFLEEKALTKGSVTVALKDGQKLTNEQIHGIQALVAASVKDLKSADVMVLNQQGELLTKADQNQNLTNKLEDKLQLEMYLRTKAEQLLADLFSINNATVNVDVTIDYREVNKTTETINPGVPSSLKTNRQFKDVQKATEDQNKTQTQSDDGGYKKDIATELVEANYTNGRMVEQITGHAGDIKRMTMGVVVPEGISDASVKDIKELVGSAVGFSEERGDVISVYKITTGLSTDVTHDDNHIVSIGNEVPSFKNILYHADQLIWVALLILLVTCLLLINKLKTRQLSDLDKDALLKEIMRWVDKDTKI